MTRTPASYHYLAAVRHVHAAAALPGQTDASALALALFFARTRESTHPEWVPRLEREARRAVSLRRRWRWAERAGR